METYASDFEMGFTLDGEFLISFVFKPQWRYMKNKLRNCYLNHFFIQLFVYSINLIKLVLFVPTLCSKIKILFCFPKE